MRYFKLKALSCSGKGNRVLRSTDNEILQEGAFHDPDALVAKGFIYEVDEKGNALNVADAPKSAKAKTDEAPAETSGALEAAAAVVGEPGEDSGSDEGDASPVAGKSKDDFKKSELQELCDAVGIEYDDKDTKADLLEALQDHYGDNA